MDARADQSTRAKPRTPALPASMRFDTDTALRHGRLPGAAFAWRERAAARAAQSSSPDESTRPCPSGRLLELAKDLPLPDAPDPLAPDRASLDGIAPGLIVIAELDLADRADLIAPAAGGIRVRPRQLPELVVAAGGADKEPIDHPPEITRVGPARLTDGAACCSFRLAGTLCAAGAGRPLNGTSIGYASLIGTARVIAWRIQGVA